MRRKINNMRNYSAVLLGISIGLFVYACKTSGTSTQQALPVEQIGDLSLDEWVAACQTELNNPQTAAQSRADLQALAQTTDCANAYPIVKSIVEQYRSR